MCGWCQAWLPSFSTPSSQQIHKTWRLLSPGERISLSSKETFPKARWRRGKISDLQGPWSQPSTATSWLKTSGKSPPLSVSGCSLVKWRHKIRSCNKKSGSFMISSWNWQSGFLLALYLFFLIFIYLFLAVLSFSRCGSWGLLFIVVRALLTAVAPRGGGSPWRWLLLLWSTGSRSMDFSRCSMWALEHRLW